MALTEPLAGEVREKAAGGVVSTVIAQVSCECRTAPAAVTA
jgi:hypothetical protein